MRRESGTHALNTLSLFQSPLITQCDKTWGVEPGIEPQGTPVHDQCT